jgi:hypothetical protein
MTWAPSSASMPAQARPIPEVDPVTRAVLPVTRPVLVQSLDDGCVRLSASLAHGLKAESTPGSLQFVQQ